MQAALVLLAGSVLFVAPDWRVLAARGDRTCASHSDGALYCWGARAFAGNDWLPEAQRPGRLVVLGTELQHCVINRHDHMGCGYSGIHPSVLMDDTRVRARDVALDARHGCHIDGSGQVFCWRWTSDLGTGLHPVDGYEAISVPLADAVALVAHAADEPEDRTSMFCALRSGGEVDCWRPDCRQRPLPVVRVAVGVAELSSGRHVCARTPRGEVTCWNGTQDLCAGGAAPGSTAVTLSEPAVDIEVGQTLACARGATGDVACWPLRFERPALAAVPVPGPAAVALAVGRSHACLRDRSDVIWCWGAAASGQLLDRAFLDEVAEPSRIDGIDDAVALAGTPDRVCALRSDHRVACWGATSAPGAPPAWSSSPRLVPGVEDATAVFATGPHELCARRSTGDVACWGATASMRTVADARMPTRELRESSSCEVDLLGRVWCGGSSLRGQRGCEPRAPTPSRPTSVCELSEPAVEVARGRAHACARHASGNVSCWGDNRSFQLGQATEPARSAGDPSEDPWYAPTALRVPGIDDAAQLLAVGDYTCAMHESGAVSCWGSNAAGQCGEGSGEPSDEPVQVELPPRRLVRASMNAF